MPIGGLHSVENAILEIRRYVLMEKIAHGIDEHPARSPPRKRLSKTLRAKRKIESALKRMPGRASKSLGDPLSVAIVAAARDLSATRYRIPRGISPFNSRVIAHLLAP